MSNSRIALVTGANQGLGLALVEALAAGMAPQDRVLLTGRDPERVAAAVAVAGGQAVARIDGRVLDVRDGEAIAALAAELGEVDIAFSNATARMSPDADPADEVDAVAATSNSATTWMLRAFAPRLRPGGRLIIVASALGTLDKLEDRAAARFARAAEEDLDAVDALVAEWRQAVHDGTAQSQGYGTWLNIPSKVAQVAAVRAIARQRRDADLAENKLLMALCPGLIDTDASRPWFQDMSSAQTPAGRLMAGRARSRPHIRPDSLRRARSIRQRPPVDHRHPGRAHGNRMTRRLESLVEVLTRRLRQAGSAT